MITPKFKTGQIVWIVFRNQVKSFKIWGVVFDEEFKTFRYTLKDYVYDFYKLENSIFSTAEEAKGQII